MTLLILTQPNVDAVKMALRRSIPGIRSAHLTEALAAALGFKTNAALRATIAQEKDRPPMLVEAEPKRFTIRLAELGHASLPTTFFIAAMRQEGLAATPYAWLQNGDRVASNEHISACEMGNRPTVIVKMARQYAALEWDCITIDPQCDEHVSGPRSSHLVDTMFKHFQRRAKGAPGNPLFCGSAFTGSITKLLPETAKKLAEDYFRLLYMPLRDLHTPRRAGPPERA
jgi:hypothetical protein